MSGLALRSPVDANATRRRHFRSHLRGRGAAYVFVLGSAAAVVVGAWQDLPVVMAAGPAGLGLLILIVAFITADRRAALDFYAGFAAQRGLVYDRTASVLPLSPLLGAGEHRRFEHVMHGPLDRGYAGADVIMALYSYDAHVELYEDGKIRLRPVSHQFTVCIVDAAAAMRRFRGVFLRRRRGLLDRLGDDWLGNLPLRHVSMESAAFDDAYDLQVVEDQDDVRVRQLFSPSLVAWLAEHPLHPCLELRAGTLVVYVPGHVEDTGHLAWLHDAARGITRRLARDRDNAQAVATPV